MLPRFAGSSREGPPRRILSLIGSVSTNFCHVEQPIVFVFSVTNAGPEAADVILTNTLPWSATFLSAQVSQGGFRRFADQIVWNLGNLPTGGQALVSISAKFSAAGLATNIAEVTCAACETALTPNLSVLRILAVNDLPSISAIAGQTTLRNTPTAPIKVTVTDNETPAANLIVLGSSSNKQLVPDENLVFSGAGSHRSLIIIPAPDQTGAAGITLSVLDADGGVTDHSFDLVVAEPTEPLVIEGVELIPVTLNTEPIISRVESEGAMFSFFFTAEPGISYAVESCDSLLSASWQTLTNVSNLAKTELVKVTDPMDRPQRFYRVMASALAASSVRLNLRFTAKAGRSYTIEYRDSLSSPSWLTLTNLGPVAADTESSVSDADVTQAQRFYRLRSP